MWVSGAKVRHIRHIVDLQRFFAKKPGTKSGTCAG